MLLGAASNPRALWYLTRGFGMVSLILLTLSLVLGVAQVARFARPGFPRFVVGGLHRNATLLAVGLVVVHVATAVADPFAPIGLVDAFVPFVGRYRPVWLGFGALAGDLLLALVITSLARTRIGPRTWKAVHWCAYACWPVAVVHALGTGSDTRIGWAQLVYVACVVAALGALAWRLTTRWAPLPDRWRLAGAAGAVVLAVAIGTWSAVGPLRSGWSKRAGTPTSLLAGGPATAAPPHGAPRYQRGSDR